MSNMYELESRVCDEVREQWQELVEANDDADPNDTWAHNAMSDAISEIADGAVPVYTGDLMELAAQNITLATSTPELGPAFGGEPTPVNIIAANVYERLTEVAHDEWNRIIDAYDPDDNDE